MLCDSSKARSNGTTALNGLSRSRFVPPRLVTNDSKERGRDSDPNGFRSRPILRAHRKLLPRTRYRGGPPAFDSNNVQPTRPLLKTYTGFGDRMAVRHAVFDTGILLRSTGRIPRTEIPTIVFRWSHSHVWYVRRLKRCVWNRLKYTFDRRRKLVKRCCTSIDVNWENSAGMFDTFKSGIGRFMYPCVLGDF